MRIHNKTKVIKVALYAAIIACAGGAATGTYAWYSYQKDVSANASGTTIKADTEIQVGLCSKQTYSTFENEFSLGEIELPAEVAKYDENDTDTFYIYWIRGKYFTDILRSFQREIGSAQGTLRAITSGKYTPGMNEDIGNASPAANTWNGFKKTPSSKPSEYKYGSLIQENDKSDFFYLPLAFRVISNHLDEDGKPIYVEDQEIFLTEFTTTDLDAVQNSDLDVGDALRCKVDYPFANTTGDNFIFDPNGASDVDLAVGGNLNLDFDPYYDYVERTKQEVAYGEWDEPIVYKDTPTADNGQLMLTIDECSTFEANNKIGNYQIDRTQSHPSVCHTLSRDSAINVNKQVGKGITTTSNYKNYGYVDLSIYLEGWDRNIVNSIIEEEAKSTFGHEFSIELGFSIN
jgi:hypothetical protein